MQSFTTDEHEELLGTKLVDIMEDFTLSGNKTLTIVKEEEDNSLLLVTTKCQNQSSNKSSTNETQLPNWTVSPYDLGGHSPYFSSQKIFSSHSSFFFLIFSM